METNNQLQTGPDNLINPEILSASPKKSDTPKIIKVKKDGIVERNSEKTVTNDGRELLKELII